MTPEHEQYLRMLASKMDAVAYDNKQLQKACRTGTSGQVRTFGRRLIANTQRLLRAWPKN